MGHVIEGFIEVTGGKVWYRKVGDGQGVPLLVLHGGPGGMTMDSDPLVSLGDERPIIYYDQLGCGRSDRSNDSTLWTVERYVEELEQVRLALELEEVHILGHSWGTMLAASYVLTKQPKGIKSVIFSSPALSAIRWERDQREYLKDLPKEVQDTIEVCEKANTTNSEAYQNAMIAFYERHVCRKLPWSQDLMEALEQMNPEIYGQMWGASEFTVTGTLRDYDITNRLHELEIPSLFMCGRFDEAAPETTQYYSSLVSGAEFKVLEECSHMTYVEAPQLFSETVRDFLNRQ
ncbi:proline iminopeptidase-family hydrolase [Pseudoneobacillus sp. C159]